MNKYIVMVIMTIGLLSCDNVSKEDDDIKTDLNKDGTAPNDVDPYTWVPNGFWEFQYSQKDSESIYATRPENKYTLDSRKVTIGSETFIIEDYKDWGIRKQNISSVITTPKECSELFDDVDKFPRIIYYNPNQFPIVDWEHGVDAVREVETNYYFSLKDPVTQTKAYIATDDEDVTEHGTKYRVCKIADIRYQTYDDYGDDIYTPIAEFHISELRVRLEYNDDSTGKHYYYEWGTREDDTGEYKIVLNSIFGLVKDGSKMSFYPKDWDKPKMIDNFGIHM